MSYKKFVLKSALYLPLILQSGHLIANEEIKYQSVGADHRYSSLNFIRVSSADNTITRSDFKKLISSFGGPNSCGFQAKMTAINESLIIKLIGHDFVKNGIPKTNTSNQNRFYELALQSNSIPTAEDKSDLLKVLFDQSCMQPDFGYDSKLIRDFWAQDVRVRSILKAEIVRDQVTYKEISERLSGSQAMSEAFEKEFKAAIEKNPDLAQDFFKTMIPVMSFLNELINKYGIKQ